MATEHQIYLNYREAMRAADKLEELSEELQRCGNCGLSEVCADIRLNWKGENADAFLGGSHILLDRNNELVRRMKDISSTIREAAENMYRAEMEVLRIANERLYG